MGPEPEHLGRRHLEERALLPRRAHGRIGRRREERVRVEERHLPDVVVDLVVEPAGQHPVAERDPLAPSRIPNAPSENDEITPVDCSRYPIVNLKRPAFSRSNGSSSS
jgi:hypothetical protein